MGGLTISSQSELFRLLRALSSMAVFVVDKSKSNSSPCEK